MGTSTPTTSDAFACPGDSFMSFSLRDRVNRRPSTLCIRGHTISQERWHFPGQLVNFRSRESVELSCQACPAIVDPAGALIFMLDLGTLWLISSGLCAGSPPSTLLM